MTTEHLIMAGPLEVCCKYKINTEFKRYPPQSVSVIIFFNWLQVEMIIFWIYWVVQNILLKFTSSVFSGCHVCIPSVSPVSDTDPKQLARDSKTFMCL